MKKMKILICRILKAVHYRVYKGFYFILHTPMGRTHGENSMSKLDNDARRVANIYIWNYPCMSLTVVVLLVAICSCSLFSIFYSVDDTMSETREIITSNRCSQAAFYMLNVTRVSCQSTAFWIGSDLQYSYSSGVIRGHVCNLSSLVAPFVIFFVVPLFARTRQRIGNRNLDMYIFEWLSPWASFLALVVSQL